MKTKNANMILLFLIVFVLLLGGNFINKELFELRETVIYRENKIKSSMEIRSILLQDCIKKLPVDAYSKNIIFTEIENAKYNLSEAVSEGDLNKIKEANDQLSDSLDRLIVIRENYPELTAGTEFNSFNTFDSRIYFITEVKDYNNAVMLYNDKVVSFPYSIIAKMKQYTVKDIIE